MTYWTISCENYEGENENYYFEYYEIAKKNFDRLCEKHKNYDEFELEDNYCSWFDADYNEYSTYITLHQTTIHIYNKVIF